MPKPRTVLRAESPALAATLALALLAPACNPAERRARETIERFATAVQTDDVGALRCLLAGAADPSGSSEFDAWVQSRLDAYRLGRDRGWVDFGDDGVALTKAFALGRGTYWEIESVGHRGDDALDAVMAIRFAYGHIDLSGLVPGTVFYVCGTPVGRIQAVRVPESGGRYDLEVLDEIRVRWTLVHAAAAGDCPDRFTVASAVPVPGSERTARVTWIF